jgi:3-hydroxyacyl-[acyl-carrier-protein] dehydratase
VNLRHALEIAAEHPAFAGHFPGRPILPGAVLLDEALRLIEISLALDMTQWQVSSAKFLSIVRPGDALTVEHTSPVDGVLRFTVRCADRTALAGTLLSGPAIRRP